MPTPKKRYLDSTPAVIKQQLAKMNKQANARERNIAKAYLEAGPNIVNLAKAAYHWYNSVPWLGGKDENGNILVTGEVPTPGMRSPKSIVKGVRTITKANAHKITPKQWTAAQDAAIARGDMAEAQRLRDLHFMTKALILLLLLTESLYNYIMVQIVILMLLIYLDMEVQTEVLLVEEYIQLQYKNMLNYTVKTICLFI